jgi:hypothetical protein
MRGLREGFHVVQRGKILFQSMFLRIKAIITNSGARPLFSWKKQWSNAGAFLRLTIDLAFDH